MTLHLHSCEHADPDMTADKVMALGIAITLERGRPYPDHVMPVAIFSGSPDARLIAGLLRRLAGDDRSFPDRAGNGVGPGL